MGWLSVVALCSNAVVNLLAMIVGGLLMVVSIVVSAVLPMLGGAGGLGEMLGGLGGAVGESKGLGGLLGGGTIS